MRTNDDDSELLHGPGRIARGGARPQAQRFSSVAQYRASGAGVGRRVVIVQRRPQALLKVTSFGRGTMKVGEHARYITRKGELEIETETGERLSARPAIRSLIAEWAEEGFAPAAKIDQQRRARDTANIVLGVPPGADREQLSNAVRAFAAEAFAGHRYAWVRHDDTAAPHVHLMLHLTKENGRKPHLSVKQTEAWRGLFAAHARAHGIEVDASRAWERGRAPRGKSAQTDYRRFRAWKALPEAERAARRARGQRPALDTTYKAFEAAQATAGKPRPPTPWEARRQANVAERRAEYQADAGRLDASARERSGKEAGELRRLAAQMRAFAASLRVTPTRQQELERAARGRGRDAAAELEI